MKISHSYFLLIAVMALGVGAQIPNPPPFPIKVLNGDHLSLEDSVSLSQLLMHEFPARIKPSVGLPADAAALYKQLYEGFDREGNGIVNLGGSRYVLLANFYGFDEWFHAAILLELKRHTWRYLSDTQSQSWIQTEDINDVPLWNMPGDSSDWESATVLDLDGDGQLEVVLCETGVVHTGCNLSVIGVKGDNIRFLNFNSSSALPAINRTANKFYVLLCQDLVTYAVDGVIRQPRCRDREDGVIRWWKKVGNELKFAGHVEPSETEFDPDANKKQLRVAAAMVSPQRVSKGELMALLVLDYLSRQREGVNGDLPPLPSIEQLKTMEPTALSKVHLSGMATGRWLSETPFEPDHLYQTCTQTPLNRRSGELFIGDYFEMTGPADVDWATLVVGPTKVDGSYATFPAQQFGPDAMSVPYGGAYLIVTKLEKFSHPKKELDETDPTAPVRSPFFGEGRFFTAYQRFTIPECSILAAGAAQYAKAPDTEYILPAVWAKYRESPWILYAQPQIWIEGNYQNPQPK